MPRMPDHAFVQHGEVTRQVIDAVGSIEIVWLLLTDLPSTDVRYGFRAPWPRCSMRNSAVRLLALASLLAFVNPWPSSSKTSY